MKGKFKKFVSLIIAYHWTLSLFRFVNRKKLLILYYHRVVKKEELKDKKVTNMYTDTNNFEEQMKFLTNFFNPVSEKDIICAIERRDILPERSVWVTLDDGYKDNFTNAYPILKKYGIPATFFITSGYVNKQVLPCGDFDKIFMNWDEIKELGENGFSIGIHTVSHRILATLSKEEIEKEIFESKNEIEKKLGRKVFSFAYPRGKNSDCSFDVCLPILKDYGFKLAVTTIGGSNNLHSNKNYLSLKRFGVSYEDTLAFFKVKVSAGGFWQK